MAFRILRSNRTKLAVGVGLCTSLGLTTATAYVLNDKKASDLSTLGLDGKTYRPFRLREVKKYNHNTNLFIFELPDPKAIADLPTASFLLAKTNLDGKEIIRPYTPIDSHVEGDLTLLIKNYEQGKMSKFIHHLKPGDKLLIQGPLEKISYIPNMKKEIGMIAGGTGITPMLQVINKIVSNPADKTKINLVFANISKEDILLKEQLDGLSKKHPNFKVHYVLEKVDKDWKGGRGHVNEDMIKTYMPAPTNKDALIMVCGPPGMMNAISGPKAPDYSQGKLDGTLAKMKYTPEQVFKF